jgi:hypothetical protein
VLAHEFHIHNSTTEVNRNKQKQTETIKRSRSKQKQAELSRSERNKQKEAETSRSKRQIGGRLREKLDARPTTNFRRAPEKWSQARARARENAFLGRWGAKTFHCTLLYF